MAVRREWLTPRIGPVGASSVAPATARMLAGRERAGELDPVADGAACVDRVEDRLMPAPDDGGAAVVLTADVHEVALGGEERSERRSVGLVPGLLRLLEHGCREVAIGFSCR